MSTARVVGLDVARGIAVLGMAVAHVGDDDAARLPNGGSWLEVFDGRSAACFALLAGVSAALLSADPQRLGHARARILARALVLLVLGAFLDALGTPVVVILPAYAVMFAMLTAALSWRPRTLLVAAAAVTLAAPPLVLWLRDVDPQVGFVSVLWQRYYPPLVWIAYLLTGLAVGRVLRRPTTPARLVAWGLPLAVLGLGAGTVGDGPLLTTTPHSSSPAEVVANVGVVLVVLAACLVVGERAPRAVAPLAATGALALTAYAGQVVAIAICGDQVVYSPSAAVTWAFVLATPAFCWAWRATLGRGPLERVVHEVSASVADAVTPGR